MQLSTYLNNKKAEALLALQCKPNPQDPTSGDDAALRACEEWTKDESALQLSYYLKPWLDVNLVTLDQVVAIEDVYAADDELKKLNSLLAAARELIKSLEAENHEKNELLKKAKGSALLLGALKALLSDISAHEIPNEITRLV